LFFDIVVGGRQMLEQRASQEQLLGIKPCITAFLVVFFPLLFLTAPTAKADSLTWNWTVSTNGLSGSGTLVTGTATNPPMGIPCCGPAYFVSSMSGQFGGLAVMLQPPVFRADGSLASGSLIRGGTDTRFSPFDPTYGLNFETSDGHLWRLIHPDIGPSGIANLLFSYSDNQWNQAQVTMLQQVPEPSTVVLLILGICLLWITLPVPKQLTSCKF
jgi:hypothetical protein